MVSSIAFIHSGIGSPLALTVFGSVVAANGLQHCFNGHRKTGITQIALGIFSIITGVGQLATYTHELEVAVLDLQTGLIQLQNGCADFAASFTPVMEICNKLYKQSQQESGSY